MRCNLVYGLRQQVLQEYFQADANQHHACQQTCLRPHISLQLPTEAEAYVCHHKGYTSYYENGSQ